MANDAAGRRDGQARSFEEGLGAGGNARHDDVAARAREGHVGAEHVHAQALEEGGRNSLRDEHHDVVAVHTDAERGEKAALRGAVARIAAFVNWPCRNVTASLPETRIRPYSVTRQQGAVVVRANRPASSPASAVVQALALQFIEIRRGNLCLQTGEEAPSSFLSSVKQVPLFSRSVSFL